MTSCWACETELRPEWKFCIQCGVPVEEDSDVTKARAQLSPIAAFGWIFAALGAVLLIVGVVVFLSVS